MVLSCLKKKNELNTYLFISANLQLCNITKPTKTHLLAFTIICVVKDLKFLEKTRKLNSLFSDDGVKALKQWNLIHLYLNVLSLYFHSYSNACS